MFIVSYDVILLLLAIYAARLYQQDGHNVIDIIFCNFHLIKGMLPKICGNWVSFVILWYRLPYWRTETKNLQIFKVSIYVTSWWHWWILKNTEVKEVGEQTRTDQRLNASQCVQQTAAMPTIRNIRNTSLGRQVLRFRMCQCWKSFSGKDKLDMVQDEVCKERKSSGRLRKPCWDRKGVDKMQFIWEKCYLERAILNRAHLDILLTEFGIRYSAIFWFTELGFHWTQNCQLCGVK